MFRLVHLEKKEGKIYGKIALRNNQAIIVAKNFQNNNFEVTEVNNTTIISANIAKNLTAELLRHSGNFGILNFFAQSISQMEKILEEIR